MPTFVKENRLVDWIQNITGTDAEGVRHGIGDDAAVLCPIADGLVVTTDLIADGSHFDSANASARQIGRKAMAVNLSDIAAMAARPIAAFVSLLLPRSVDQNYAEELMASAVSMGREFHCPVAGGDTNSWDGKLAINVLIIGQISSRGPLLRSTAKPNDWLLVTGALGGSLAGRHFEFTPRICEAMLLQDRYHLGAGMDLSDGLAMDLRRLCSQSGCGAEIELDALPISAAARQLSSSQPERIRRALADGEDFELLLAVEQDEAQAILRDQPLDVPITKVGRCIAGTEIWQISEGKRTPMPNMGYEHGGSGKSKE